jgi:hypothetical protein
MGITEKTIFQSAFSLKIWVGERVSILAKKFIAMPSVKHRDVFTKPLGRLFLHLSEVNP